MQGILADITERKQAAQRQRELELERERAAMLQRFIGDVSHDLRTPLTTIKTRLYLIRNTLDSDKQQSHIEILEAQTAHLERLLKDMLRMSRLDEMTAFQLEPLAVNALIRDVLVEQEPLAMRRKHIVHFTGDQNLPLVQADRTNLRRAITNIVVNALHYTPDEGSIIIRSYTQTQHAVIEVCDTGIGIGVDDLPHIFERFYRADAARGTVSGGAGLGLAIAKKVVEGHQGNIEVESELGKGSTFKILLPIGD